MNKSQGMNELIINRQIRHLTTQHNKKIDEIRTRLDGKASQTCNLVQIALNFHHSNPSRRLMKLFLFNILLFYIIYFFAAPFNFLLLASFTILVLYSYFGNFINYYPHLIVFHFFISLRVH
jgi:hypothetical protein